MNNLYYLHTLGIQKWFVRKIQQKNLYSYALRKSNILIGYLVLEGPNGDLTLNCSVSELMNSIMAAFSIKLHNQQSHTYYDSLISRINQEKAILMVNEATANELLQKIPNKLMLPDPNSLLLNPLMKKEVWVKLGYFT